MRTHLPLLGCTLLVACGGGGSGATDDPTPTDGGADTDTSPPAACDDTTFAPIERLDDWNVVHDGDRAAFYWVPPNPRAIVFMFHGGGGSAENMSNLHQTKIQNTYVESGIAFIVAESEDRATGQWDGSRNANQNADMQNMVEHRDALIAEGPLTADVPVFSWGFSAGGYFSGDFAELAADLGWPIRGFIPRHAGPRPDTALPGLYASGENDGDIALHRSSADKHAESNAASQYLENLERAWTPEEMLLHPNYDMGEAQAVHDELIALGVIDADGGRLVALDELERSMNQYENASALPGPTRVTNQLRVAWATHRVSSEFACEERDFVLQHAR